MAGRPSNNEQRRKEVMDAYVKTVASNGLEGATLDVIAKTANLSRPLIRHHLGNKKEMLSALADHVLEMFDKSTHHLSELVPKIDGTGSLIEILSDPCNSEDPELVLVFAALTMKCGGDPELAKRLRLSIEKFENTVSLILADDFPNAKSEHIQTVSHGIVAIYFNMASLKPLGFSEEYNLQVKAAMNALITLVQENER